MTIDHSGAASATGTRSTSGGRSIRRLDGHPNIGGGRAGAQVVAVSVADAEGSEQDQEEGRAAEESVDGGDGSLARQGLTCRSKVRAGW